MAQRERDRANPQVSLRLGEEQASVELEAQVVEGGLAGDSIGGNPCLDIGGGLFTGKRKGMDEIASLPFAFRLFSASASAKSSLSRILARRPALRTGAALSRLHFSDRSRSHFHYVAVFTDAAARNPSSSDTALSFQADMLVFRIQQEDETATPVLSIPTHLLFDDLPAVVGAFVSADEEADHAAAEAADDDSLISPASGRPSDADVSRKQSPTEHANGCSTGATPPSKTPHPLHGDTASSQPSGETSAQKSPVAFGDHEVKPIANGHVSSNHAESPNASAIATASAPASPTQAASRPESVDAIRSMQASYTQVAAAAPTQSQSGGKSALAEKPRASFVSKLDEQAPAASQSGAPFDSQSSADEREEHQTQKREGERSGLSPERPERGAAASANASDVHGEDSHQSSGSGEKADIAEQPPKQEVQLLQEQETGENDRKADNDVKQQQSEQQAHIQRKPANWSELVASTAPGSTPSVKSARRVEPDKAQTQPLQSQQQQQQAQSKQKLSSGNAAIKGQEQLSRPQSPGPAQKATSSARSHQQQAHSAVSSQQQASRVSEVLERTGYAWVVESNNPNETSGQRHGFKRTASAYATSPAGGGSSDDGTEKSAKELLNVENSKVGQVIGKSGNTVNAIRKETGATIDILTSPERNSNANTPIVLRGSASKVKAAKWQIEQLLEQPPHSPEQRALQEKHLRRLHQLQGKDLQQTHQLESDQSEPEEGRMLPNEDASQSEETREEIEKEKKIVNLPKGITKQLLGPHGQVH